MSKSVGEPMPIGTVAQETARLLQALGAATGEPAAKTVGGQGDSPPDPQSQPAEAGHPDPAAHTHTGEGGDHAHDEGCAHEHVPMGEAITCSLCPVCQGIAIVRSLSPQTLDRVAELAAVAAATLRDLADQAAAGPEKPSHHAASTPRERTRRESIDITDEPDDVEDMAR